MFTDTTLPGNRVAGLIPDTAIGLNTPEGELSGIAMGVLLLKVISWVENPVVAAVAVSWLEAPKQTEPWLAPAVTGIELTVTITGCEIPVQVALVTVTI